tara:strand:+ start:121 stop:309 length:189 start_codon:yes stop_codon:yes gene_type:complete
MQKAPKKRAGQIKVHKTLTMHVELFGLLEQIRQKQGLDTADEAIEVSIRLTAKKLGITQDYE